MKLATKYLGEIETSEKDILHFSKGIPGFPAEKKFVVLPLSNDEIFQVLQSTENQQIAFVITNPFHFFKEYDFKLEDSSVQELQLQNEKDVLVYSILTVQEPFEKTTANLQAPIIVNSINREAKQIILNDSTYTTKHSIFHGALSVSSKE